MYSIPLNPEKVPEEVRPLLPLSARWHIGDDFDREAEVASASLSELRELVAGLEGKEGDFLFEWLAGQEAYSSRPSEEYLALTHMTMAAASARVKIKREETQANKLPLPIPADVTTAADAPVAPPSRPGGR